MTPPDGTMAGLTYRMRNVLTGLCLDKSYGGGDVNGAPITVYTCHGDSNQRWTAPVNDDQFQLLDGFQMVGRRDNRCVDIPGYSEADGVLLQVYQCTGAWNQRWRLRTAPDDCTVRSREWTRTELCASTDYRVQGLIGNWRHHAATLSYVDPAQYVLSHEVNNFIALSALDGQGAPGYTGIETGSRALRSPEVTGRTSYSAYWLEWGQGQQRYHALSPEQAPGSDDADGRNHTYLLLGKDDDGQWDVFYDFNYVGSTALQAGATTRAVRTGLAVRYLHASEVDTPYQHRIQVMEANEVWRRPYLAETGTGEPKTCEAPPRYEDWTFTQPNLSPWCFTTAYDTRAGSGPTGPTQIDRFTVAKPGSRPVTGNPGTKQDPRYSPGRVNGVDQARLAACMNADATRCLTDVPGLASCVAARAVCSTLTRPADRTGPTTARAPMTLDEARAAAVRSLAPADAAVGAATSTHAATISAGSWPATTGAPWDTRTTKPTDAVHVISAPTAVRGLAASDPAAYAGYVLVYHASSHRLLYGCLGVNCPRLR